MKINPEAMPPNIMFMHLRFPAASDNEDNQPLLKHARNHLEHQSLLVILFRAPEPVTISYHKQLNTIQLRKNYALRLNFSTVNTKE